MVLEMEVLSIRHERNDKQFASGNWGAGSREDSQRIAEGQTLGRQQTKWVNPRYGAGKIGPCWQPDNSPEFEKKNGDDKASP